MSVRSISEEEFYSHDPAKEAAAILFAEEISWYSDSEKNLIGTVILDKTDMDWGYVIMAIQEDGQYRSVKVNVSMNSQDDAEEELLTKMNKMDSSGEIRELLFKDQGIEISKINVTDINSEIKRYFKNHPEKLYEISPRKFEELVADIFNDLGFDVELTKATRDGGRDIIARIRSTVADYLTYIECKRYAAEHKVGVSIIREVSGIHYFKKPAQSIIVTTSFFTKDAKEEARQLENQLALKDYNNIKEWLSNY